MKKEIYTNRINEIKTSCYRFMFLLFILNSFFCYTVLAQNFHLVKDINTATDASPDNYYPNLLNYNAIHSFAVLNGVSYFSANDGVHGLGLWRSDGTPAGTYQLKEGINPVNIIASSGKLFFSGLGNPGLWKSDGTEAGTVPVLDIVPAGLGTFQPAGLVTLNGVAFFAIDGHSVRDQLWKTDGTAAGTLLVKDFYSPVADSAVFQLTNLIVIKNKVYFSGSYNGFNNSSTTRLWASNGTAAGTYLISNNLWEPAQMIARSSDNSDPLVYFTASATQYGNRSLYVTSGVAGDAAPAEGFTGIFPSYSYYGTDLVNAGGFIYFTGALSAGADQPENLYRYPVNGGEVQGVKEISGAIFNGLKSFINNVTQAGNYIFFNVFDAQTNKNQFWRSAITGSENLLLKDGLFQSDAKGINGVLYFPGAGDENNGYELWKSDGSVAGTVLVKDISPGPGSSNPYAYTSISNKILFSASEGVHGAELWQTDGTAAGTSIVKDINQVTTSSSNPTSFTTDNNLLFFTAYIQGDRVYKHWKSDGTSAGTSVISDTVYNEDPNLKMTFRNNSAYFWGKSISGKRGIYKFDESTSGTVMVKDFKDINIVSNGSVATANLVYFCLNNYSTGKYELWRTDGTAANTYVLKNDFPYYIGINNFTVVGNRLFFIDNNSSSLWKTDGTVEGTVTVKPFSNLPYNLTAHNGMLFFCALNIASDITLWKSDGTFDGTNMITDKVTSVDNLVSSNGELFFTATGVAGIYGNLGRELFKTDGTADGTVLVKDIHTGAGNTFVDILASMNGYLLFFTNATLTNNLELWKSDGTNDGTELVSSFSANSLPYVNATVCSGKLFFLLSDSKLWQSDGTAAGTHIVTDDIFSRISMSTYNTKLASVGDKLFFNASNYQYGEELYAGTIAVDYYISSAAGNWNNPATWIGNVVPPAGSNVIVRTNVTSNINTSCSSLRIESPGLLTVNTGIRIQVLQ